MKYSKILTFLLVVCWLCLVAKFDSRAIQHNFVPIETLPENAERCSKMCGDRVSNLRFEP